MSALHYHADKRGERRGCRNDPCSRARCTPPGDGGTGMSVAEATAEIAPEALRVIRLLKTPKLQSLIRSETWRRWLRGPRPYHLGGKEND